MKSNFLYHGSPRKLNGGRLIPTLAEDLAKNPENMKRGVYATDKKEIAIAMAIISTKGVIGAGLDNFGRGRYGKIYLGKPKQKYISLHYLPIKTFKKSKGVRNQFFSEGAVEPVKTEKLLVEDYIGLVKYATKREIKGWKEKYGE
jgi:hypothetical protein